MSMSSLGTVTSHVLVFCPTRRDIRYKLISALVCGGSIHGCLGTVMNVSGSSHVPMLNLRSVVGMGGGIPGSGDKGIVTMCCTCKRVSNNSSSTSDRRNVSSGGIVGSLHGLGSSRSMGTMMLHMGSPNKDTCNSRRV